MPQYRIYLRDTAGRLLDRSDVTFVDDESVMVFARRLMTSSSWREIWGGARLVGTVPTFHGWPPESTSARPPSAE